VRKLPSIVSEIDQQGRYLDRILRAHKLEKLSWIEFRRVAGVIDRLSVNLADFNVLHFGPSNLRHPKSPIKASKAAGQARRKKSRKKPGAKSA
jgi:hypothetical protein